MKIARVPLERVVEAAVLARLALADAGEVFTVGVDQDEFGAAKDDLADLRATMKGHYRQAAMRRLSPEGLAEMEAELKPQITKAEDRVRKLQTPSGLAALGGPARILQDWPNLTPTQRRTVLTTLADVVVMPALRKGGRGLDPRRLDRSRWHGDPHTWGELLGQDTPAAA